MNFKNIKSFFLSREKRALLFLFAGASLNVSYATYELLISIKYSDFWSGAVAIYYIFLSSVKILLLKGEKRLSQLSDSFTLKNEGRKIYVFSGILLFSLNIIMIIIVVGIIFFGSKSRGQTQIIIAAIYALFRVIIALKDIFYYRNTHNYIISAAKTISLSVALIALFSLQSSMLTALMVENSIAIKTNIISALAMLIAEFSISVYMVAHK